MSYGTPATVPVNPTSSPVDDFWLFMKTFMKTEPVMVVNNTMIRVTALMNSSWEELI